MGLKILIVDDEEHIVELLKFNLEVKGYKVLCAYDGVDGFNLAKEEKPDLVLLDLMLPGIDGIEVCRRMKSDSELKKTPVIMLTAKNLEQDKIKGLEIGADDYITKPFSLAVLRARIHTQLRKHSFLGRYEHDDFIFDFNKMEFYKNSTAVELSKTEQKLLKILFENKGITIPRNDLINRVWTDSLEYVDENALSVTIKRLRDKLEDDSKNPKYIKTVYSIGYLWTVK